MITSVKESESVDKYDGNDVTQNQMSLVNIGLKLRSFTIQRKRHPKIIKGARSPNDEEWMGSEPIHIFTAMSQLVVSKPFKEEK